MAVRPLALSGVLSIDGRRSSTDLVAVAVVLAATVSAVALDAPTVIRAPLAFVVVFIAPGYTLALALFPVGESSLGGSQQEVARGDGISVLDRLVLTIGLSLSIVVLIGLAIESLPIPITTETLLGGLVGVIGGTIPVAHYRRQQVPMADRFTPFSASNPQSSGSTGSSGLDALSVLLAVSVLFAGGALAYSAGTASDDAGVTEFYFLPESGDGGTAAAGYPTNFTADQETELAVAVGNHEGERVNYTIVGQLQAVEIRNGSLEVRQRSRVVTANVSVGPNETRTVNTTVTPQDVGEYRLVFLLYEGDVPDQPRQENAYREIHLWTSVD